MLLSSWLDHLGGGRYAVDGFVRVADLDPAFRPPLGNQCDMMYLSTALESGPHLRTVLAHEYMHAVLFGQKGRRRGQAAGACSGRGRMARRGDRPSGGGLLRIFDVEYRLPRQCVPGPARTISARGGRLLRRRSVPEPRQSREHVLVSEVVCAQYGPDLLPALVHSRLRGAANLEACTGSTFAGLYRGWTLDLFGQRLEASGRESGDRDRSSAAGEKSGLGRAEWARGGPRLTRLASGSVDRWTALGTTSHYAIVDGSTSGAVEIEVSGPPEAELQVTAVLLGDDRPRLDLSAVKVRGENGEYFLRAHIKERHGMPVRLSQISWEPLGSGREPAAPAAHVVGGWRPRRSKRRWGR